MPSDADRAKLGKDDHVFVGASGRVAALVRDGGAYRKIAFLERGKKRSVRLPERVGNIVAPSLRSDGRALAAAADGERLYEVSIPNGDARKLWTARPHVEGEIRGTAYVLGDRIVALTDRKLFVLQRGKSDLEVVASAPAAEGSGLDAYLEGKLLLVSSYSKRAKTQVFGLAGNELRLLASFKEALDDSYESGGRVFGISDDDDEPRELVGFVDAYAAAFGARRVAAAPKKTAVTPKEAARIAKKSLEQFFASQDDNEEEEPLVWLQYVSARPGAAGVEVCLGLRSGSFEDDGDVQQLAQEAVAALERKHAELGSTRIHLTFDEG